MRPLENHKRFRLLLCFLSFVSTIIHKSQGKYNNDSHSENNSTQYEPETLRQKLHRKEEKYFGPNFHKNEALAQPSD